MDLRQVFEAVDYRIGAGAPYQWLCYGDSAALLDLCDIEGVVVGSVIYDTRTQEIYEITAEYTFDNPVCYRWTASEELIRKRREEAVRREVDDTLAWDDTKYTEVEVEEDMLEKLTAIVNHEDFDRRVSIPLDLTLEQELALYRAAHANDMSLNSFVEMVLKETVEKYKDKETGSKLDYNWSTDNPSQTTTKPERKRDSKGRFVKN
ncbi:MAG: hypothetical protein N2235_23095 [Fischerella sp.]|nr:hypothetical protein [Fischerella sp.]